MPDECKVLKDMVVVLLRHPVRQAHCAVCVRVCVCVCVYVCVYVCVLICCVHGVCIHVYTLITSVPRTHSMVREHILW